MVSWKEKYEELAELLVGEEPTDRFEHKELVEYIKILKDTEAELYEIKHLGCTNYPNCDTEGCGV
jgi:hypothetical protein